MRVLFVCVAALSFLACAPASAENSNRRADNHDAVASGRGIADTGKNDRRSMQQNVTGDTRTNHGGMHQNTIDAVSQPARTRSVGTRQNKPIASTSSNEFLPASGDVHPNSQSRSTPDRTRGNSRWTGNTAAHSYNRDALQRNMQASRRVHGGKYVAPQGYQYRHWSYGERLPRLYYARDYWIGNSAVFGLFAPPSELVWVRVGDDALLIDRDTGEIVQVHYGFFY